jgi:hypothetical protein
MACAPSNFMPERNTFGRPRIHDRMKIVNDFIQYAKTHPECITVPCFTSTIGISSGLMNNWALEDDDFSEAFNIGKELIGLNRLNLVNMKLMERSIYSQVVGNFDRDINLYQRSEKEFEAQIHNKQDDNQKSPLEEMNSLKHELMLAKAELAGYKEANDRTDK